MKSGPRWLLALLALVALAAVAVGVVAPAVPAAVVDDEGPDEEAGRAFARHASSFLSTRPAQLEADAAGASPTRRAARAPSTSSTSPAGSSGARRKSKSSRPAPPVYGPWWPDHWEGDVPPPLRNWEPTPHAAWQGGGERALALHRTNLRLQDGLDMEQRRSGLAYRHNRVQRLAELRYNVQGRLFREQQRQRAQAQGRTSDWEPEPSRLSAPPVRGDLLSSSANQWLGTEQLDLEDGLERFVL